MSGETALVDFCCLLLSAALGTERGLDADRNMDKRNCRRRYAGDAAGLPQRARAHARQLLVHLARQARHLGVIEPVGDGAQLGLLQALDRLGLLIEIAGVLDFGLDRFQLVADGSG